MLARRTHGHPDDSKRAQQGCEVPEDAGSTEPALDGAGNPNRPRATCRRPACAARRNRAVLGAPEASAYTVRSGIVDSGGPALTSVVDTNVVAYYLLGTEPF